jgi:hypothetical protein
VGAEIVALQKLREALRPANRSLLANAAAPGRGNGRGALRGGSTRISGGGPRRRSEPQALLSKLKRDGRARIGQNLSRAETVFAVLPCFRRQKPHASCRLRWPWSRPPPRPKFRRKRRQFSVALAERSNYSLKKHRAPGGRPGALGCSCASASRQDGMTYTHTTYNPFLEHTYSGFEVR